MKTRFSLSLLSILLLTTVFTFGADWYRWRGPDLNGISRETGWQSEWPAAGPKVLWKASVGTGFSSIVVADGRAFTMGNNGGQESVIAFDAATGKELWRHTYAEDLAPKFYEGGPNATPTVDGDRVYTLSRSGKAFCLHAKSGKVIWSQDLSRDFGLKVTKKNHWGLAGSPFIYGDMVVFNAGLAGTAFNKASGKLIWKTGEEAAAYATPVPFTQGGQTRLLVFAAKALMAVDPATGKIVWSYPWKTNYDVNAADPIVSGNRIFLSSGYNTGGSVIEVTGTSAKEIWKNKNMRNQMNGCVLWQGHLYGVDEKQLRCLDFNTGEVKWTDRASGKGSLMMADGKLIVLGEKGELMIAPATPTGFKPTARAQVLGGKCWTVPVLSNGRIYCRNAKGDLVCLDVSGK